MCATCFGTCQSMKVCLESQSQNMSLSSVLHELLPCVLHKHCACTGHTMRSYAKAPQWSLHVLLPCDAVPPVSQSVSQSLTPFQPPRAGYICRILMRHVRSKRARASAGGAGPQPGGAARGVRGAHRGHFLTVRRRGDPHVACQARRLCARRSHPRSRPGPVQPHQRRCKVRPCPSCLHHSGSACKALPRTPNAWHPLPHVSAVEWEIEHMLETFPKKKSRHKGQHLPRVEVDHHVLGAICLDCGLLLLEGLVRNLGIACLKAYFCCAGFRRWWSRL